MPNYANGKIYKLTNNVNDEIYIGSTCCPLWSRIGQHRYVAKNGNRTSKLYNLINQIGGSNFDIVLLEAVSCTNKSELYQRERYHIDLLKPTLNKQVPGRTEKERHQQYYQANIEKRVAYNEANKDKRTAYTQANRDKLTEQHRVYFKQTKRKSMHNAEPTVPRKHKY